MHTCGLQILHLGITGRSLPARIHDAVPRGSDIPPLAEAPECGAGVLAAASATVEVVAGCLDPRPCAGDLRCSSEIQSMVPAYYRCWKTRRPEREDGIFGAQVLLEDPARELHECPSGRGATSGCGGVEGAACTADRLRPDYRPQRCGSREVLQMRLGESRIPSPSAGQHLRNSPMVSIAP